RTLPAAGRDQIAAQHRLPSPWQPIGPDNQISIDAPDDDNSRPRFQKSPPTIQSRGVYPLSLWERARVRAARRQGSTMLTIIAGSGGNQDATATRPRRHGS